MKTALTIITILALSILTGCNGSAGAKKTSAEEGKVLLTVDFQQGRKLRYKFISSRTVEVDSDPAKSTAKSRKSTVGHLRESLEMVIAYTPIEIDPLGPAIIKATCESVKVQRTSLTGKQNTRKDAVKNLAGRTFTFTVNANGKIEDRSELNKLIREMGKKAFRTKNKKGKIKEPDMIGDFIATQWFLWDSISSIEKASKGIRVGQSWKSKLSVPNPMVLPKAREVTYKLDEIRQTEKGRLAVINSSYCPAETVPSGWPNPYHGCGRFQLAGSIFGILRNYKVLSLQGRGEELFNIDTGRIEQYEQNYQTQLDASFPLPLGGVNPRITIKQKIKSELVN